MMTRDQLREMKEDALRTKVLIPLFEAMGFRDVHLYHGGILERGKDIVMWKKTEIENRENYAVVAKAQRITGKVADVSEVKTQIEQCFSSSYKDPVDGSEQSVGRCFVVSSHEIRKEAIEALSRIHRDKQIKIALLIGLAANYGPEDPDIACPVPDGNPENVFPLLFQQLVDAHQRSFRFDRL